MKKVKRYLVDKATRETWKNLVPTLRRAIFAFGLFLLVGVAVAFIKVGAILNFDQAFDDVLVTLRTPLLTKIFVWLTLLGNEEIIIFSMIVGAILFWIWRQKKLIPPFWLTVAGAQLSSSIGKHIFARPRPLAQVYAETSFSLPSGHATVAVAFYGFLLYLVWKNVKNKNLKSVLALVLLLVMLAIGFSRLYLGVHFPTDVLAGYLLGLTWLILGIGAAEFIFTDWEVEKSPVNYKQVKFISIILVILAVAFFFIFGQSFFKSEVKVTTLYGQNV